MCDWIQKLTRIETDRLILRKFRKEDWAAVLDYQINPLYLRFYPLTGRTVKEVKEFVQGFLDQQRQQPRIKFQLAVILKSTGNIIGNSGISLDEPNKNG